MTRICKISFDSSYQPSELEQELLKKASLDEVPIINEKGEINWWQHHLVDLDKVPLVPYKIEKHIYYPTRHIDNLDVETDSRPLPMNARCNVTVPGLGLLLINEVLVRTDYCTEQLNEDLKAGYRIIAVCPQPDQRRPDYVLGRVNPVEPR
jgi:hypothetical protein